MKGVVLGVLVVVATSACASGSDPISGDFRNVEGITMTLRVDPAVAELGQGVTLSINLQNNTGRDETLTFPSGKKFDFWITDGAEEVWRWSEGMFFTQAVEEVEIPGGSGESFSQTWRAATTGELTVHAELFAERFTGEMTGELEVR